MSENYYWGYLRNNKKIWIGPMAISEMKEEFDIFRHLTSYSPPPDKIISKENALKIMDEYYG